MVISDCHSVIPVLQYGDSPVYVDQDQGKDHSGVTALGQGYGLTEDDTKGILLETNVTVITNEECIEQLRFNSTRRIVRNRLTVSTNGNPGGIPYGLTSQLLCAQGMQNDEVSES